jgi:hypothetical protein
MPSSVSDNPLKLSFWTGRVDPRPFAIFRIGLGLTMLHDLFPLAGNLKVFLSDDGMLPRGLGHDWSAWSLFNLTGSSSGVSALFAVGAVALFAFTIGFQTRVATILSWLFLISFHHRNAYVTDGGDDLSRILFFWCMFADLGAAYSVDAARAKQPKATIAAIVPRILQANVAVLYLVAGILKLRFGWLHGEAIYLSLQLMGFARPFGATLAAFPTLCKLLTLSVLFLEIAFAFAAFFPFFRRGAKLSTIAMGLAIQLGILATMRVGVFTEVMLWVLVMWLDPTLLDRLDAWLRERRILGPRASDEGAPAPSSLLAKVFMAVLALQFIATVWDPFFARRLPLPAFVTQERVLLGLVQPYSLFDTVKPVPRWDAPGVLTDGTEVEVLSVVAPGARPREPGLHFSRWNKFTFKTDPPIHFDALGAWMCRAFNEQTAGAKLARFTLVDDGAPPHPPSSPPQAPAHVVLHEQRCEP